MTTTITPLTDPDYRPFSHRLAWLATGPDGYPVGSAFLRLNTKPSQRHLAELELGVHPADRRRGVGSQLLAAALAGARTNEVTTVLADTATDSPGDRFLARRGFTVGLTLIHTRLEPAAVGDALLRDLLRPRPGYRLVSWDGAPPEDLIESFTQTRAAMNDAPAGDIPYGTEPWDAERSRQVAAVVAQRGEHLHTVAAVAEATGEVVAFTELVVPADGTGEAQHYGTAVRPGHRGRGLAVWMKAEQVRQTRAQYPKLAGLLTDTAATNDPMRRANAALGYQETHRVNRYQLRLTAAGS